MNDKKEDWEFIIVWKFSVQSESVATQYNLYLFSYLFIDMLFHMFLHTMCRYL